MICYPRTLYPPVLPFSVPGVGTVVSGTTLKGVVRLNETLLLGPDLLGRFSPVQIKSIHRKRMPVTQVSTQVRSLLLLGGLV